MATALGSKPCGVPADAAAALLADTAAVAAFLDRLLHHAHVLTCGPRSWRTRESSVFDRYDIVNETDIRQATVRLAQHVTGQSRGGDSGARHANRSRRPTSPNSYAYEGTFGFLMTRAPALPSVKLEDCVGTWPGHKDHILTWDGTCVAAGYDRLRTAGWVYKDAQPNTVPVYRCYSATLQSHFASNQSSCEGLGKNEALLGYALSR